MTGQQPRDAASVAPDPSDSDRLAHVLNRVAQQHADGAALTRAARATDPSVPPFPTFGDFAARHPLVIATISEIFLRVLGRGDE